MAQRESVIQNNFTAGEWSPRMEGRADLSKYYNACLTLENMLVRPQGGAFKRPGLKYIAKVPNSDNITILIPFTYSDTDAYDLEFSDLLIRFRRTVNGVSGLILDDDGVTITSIVSPYRSADLALLKYHQSGDVMYLAHPDYKSRRLVRTDHNSWAISEVEFKRGPFMAENDTSTQMWVRGYEIDAATAAAGGTFTVTGDGDLSVYFKTDDTIRVWGSTGNNGFWTVAMTAYSAPDFVITVVRDETTPDGTGDGKVVPDMTAGHTVQLTANGDVFNSQHVGALWEFRRSSGSESVDGSFAATGTSETLAIALNQKLDFSTEGYWAGTISLEVSYDDGLNWVTYYQVSFVNSNNIELHELNDVEDALYRVNMSAYTSGTCTYTLTSQSYLNKGVLEISSVLSPRAARALVKNDLTKDNGGSTLWSEGAWSDYRGWPVAVTFFEQRIVFGGNAFQTVAIWGSKSLPGGDYHNFLAGVNDDDAIVFTLAESQDPIKWLSSDKRLLIGTAGGPYSLGASTTAEPLTPTNINRPESNGIEGAAAIMPVKTGLGHLYVDRSLRKIIELAYNWEKDGLVSIDMTRLADHITKGGITQIALQKRPETILWCITGNGKAISLTYLREEDVVGWQEHITDGTFESVSVVPGAEEDEVHFIVNRTINGATVRNIEQLQPWDWGSDDKDAFFVDSGLTHDGAEIAQGDAITNLTHLIGETVAILADGGTHRDRVVDSSGEITLDRAASVIHVGLPYTSTLKPMKIARGTLGLGSPKRIVKIAFQFYKTGYVKFGSISANMEELPFRQAGDAMDTAVPLFSGTKVQPFPGGFDPEGTLIVESDRPLPLTVQSIIMLLESS